jgi:hypothetical protein
VGQFTHSDDYVDGLAFAAKVNSVSGSKEAIWLAAPIQALDCRTRRNNRLNLKSDSWTHVQLEASTRRAI